MKKAKSIENYIFTGSKIGAGIGLTIGGIESTLEGNDYFCTTGNMLINSLYGALIGGTFLGLVEYISKNSYKIYSRFKK